MIGPIIAGGAALGLWSSCKKAEKEQPKIFTYFGFEDKDQDGMINEKKYLVLGAGEGYSDKTKEIDGDKDGNITEQECWNYLTTTNQNNISVVSFDHTDRGAHLGDLGPKALPVLKRILESESTDYRQKLYALEEIVGKPGSVGQDALESVRATGEKVLGDLLDRFIEYPHIANDKENDENKLFALAWDRFLSPSHSSKLEQIVGDHRFNTELRKKVLSAAEKKLIAQPVLEKLVLNPKEDRELRLQAIDLLRRFFKVDFDFFIASRPLINKSLHCSKIDPEYSKIETDCSFVEQLEDLAARTLPDNLAKLSKQKLLEIYSTSAEKSYNLCRVEILRRFETDPSLTVFVMENLFAHLELLKYGDATALPHLIKKITPTNAFFEAPVLIDYTNQLEKRGWLKPADLSKVERVINRYKYDCEDSMRTLVSAKDSAPSTARMARRFIAEIERRRKAAPVLIEELRKECPPSQKDCLAGPWDSPAVRRSRVPKTEHTFPYQLTLRILRLPEEATHATLIFIDPQDKKWPQNCDDSGDKVCWVAEGLGSVREEGIRFTNKFRVFLNTANNEVKAYLRYMDRDNKFVGVSNSFTVVNPDFRPAGN